MQPWREAILIVDMQNDFMPGGALPVAHAADLIEPIHRFIASNPHLPLTACRDWHPPGHISFFTSHPGYKSGDILPGSLQTLWPEHCVQSTWGAALVASLQDLPFTYIADKGEKKDKESYSAFGDGGGAEDNAFALYLRSQQIQHLYIMGVAVEFCLRNTVLSALSLGFSTTIVANCAGALDPANKEVVFGQCRELGCNII